MRRLENILVTGGAGFIGSNFIRLLLESAPGFNGRIINFDALTYAGNIASLLDVQAKFGGKRYFFERGNIQDADLVATIFEKYRIDTVVHFAAESHVDRSIVEPDAFVQTNIVGTFTLLEATRRYWARRDGVLFHHISTDEVYGSLGEINTFTETTPYAPRSPYSASKAASDHMVMAFYHTYGLPVTLSNCSNNYGPYQFPEKFIPLMILNLKEGKSLPVYGDGRNVRDWIHVDDHNRAVWQILRQSKIGESYNIGGENEWENIHLIQKLIEIIAKALGADTDELNRLITFVKDRPGHDRRYAINCAKIRRELNWERVIGFEEGLAKTVDWYLGNKEWIDGVRSGVYRQWIEQNYKER
ncbi:MAG: dTDP-glucose 4,6-dehydratase [Treponema sp.]|jgi:dTDP-glucose 4,6-dehydratase|nr:dTDP-glucose 4,6-dehydratase [Treponema sp.]